MCGWQDQLELCFMGVFGQEFSIQNTPSQLEVVAFSKELVKFGWVSWFTWALVQGPILHPHNHEAQDRVCPLGLMPIISGHAGNLQSFSYQVQDVQVTAICLSGGLQGL